MMTSGEDDLMVRRSLHAVPVVWFFSSSCFALDPVLLSVAFACHCPVSLLALVSACNQP